MGRIAQFNTQHRQQLQDANLGRLNQAQQYNLGANERNVERQMRARYHNTCLLYTSPSPRDRQKSRMPSSA